MKTALAALFVLFGIGSSSFSISAMAGGTDQAGKGPVLTVDKATINANGDTVFIAFTLKNLTGNQKTRLNIASAETGNRHEGRHQGKRVNKQRSFWGNANRNRE